VHSERKCHGDPQWLDGWARAAASPSCATHQHVD
jgi:hypothetical protein